eukprot:scaffold614_cov255-Pinguiococcus_pyrenoidosus.AAC.6
MSDQKRISRATAIPTSTSPRLDAMSRTATKRRPSRSRSLSFPGLCTAETCPLESTRISHQREEGGEDRDHHCVDIDRAGGHEDGNAARERSSVRKRLDLHRPISGQHDHRDQRCHRHAESGGESVVEGPGVAQRPSSQQQKAAHHEPRGWMGHAQRQDSAEGAVLGDEVSEQDLRGLLRVDSHFRAGRGMQTGPRRQSRANLAVQVRPRLLALLLHPHEHGPGILPRVHTTPLPVGLVLRRHLDAGAEPLVDSARSQWIQDGVEHPQRRAERRMRAPRLRRELERCRIVFGDGHVEARVLPQHVEGQARLKQPLERRDDARIRLVPVVHAVRHDAQAQLVHHVIHHISDPHFLVRVAQLPHAAVDALRTSRSRCGAIAQRQQPDSRRWHKAGAHPRGSLATGGTVKAADETEGFGGGGGARRAT